MAEKFDDVGALRMQIQVVIYLFVATVLCALSSATVFMALMFALCLIPSLPALMANMIEYYEE